MQRSLCGSWARGVSRQAAGDGFLKVQLPPMNVMIGTSASKEKHSPFSKGRRSRRVCLDERLLLSGSGGPPWPFAHSMALPTPRLPGVDHRDPILEAPAAAQPVGRLDGAQGSLDSGEDLCLMDPFPRGPDELAPLLPNALTGAFLFHLWGEEAEG